MVYAFYHRTDQDGKCCAAIFHRFLPKNSKIIGWNYGDDYDPSVIPNEAEVYIADIHFPFDDMLALNKRCKRFVWIDHHISAMEEADEWDFNPEGLRDTKEAACSLLWTWITDGQPIPYGIQLISLYDIWEHNDFTVPLNLALDSYDLKYDSHIWDIVMNSTSTINMDLAKLINEGDIINRYKTKMDSEYARLLCFPATFEGIRVLAINRGMSNSKIFDSQWDPEKYDAMMLFATKDGLSWKCGLYTTKETIDVSKICQKLGGGGHKQAAGFIWNHRTPPVSINF